MEKEWIPVNLALPEDIDDEPIDCEMKNDFDDDILEGYYMDDEWWYEKGGLSVGHYRVKDCEIEFQITHWRPKINHP